MGYRLSWILVSALWLPVPALAADAAAPLAAEHRLSEDEVKRILDTAAAKGNAPQPIEEAIDGEPPPPQIHGEVGFGIGTGGYRSAFGTAVVPLGNEGHAIISFDSTDFGSRNFPYDYGYER